MAYLLLTQRPHEAWSYNTGIDFVDNQTWKLYKTSDAAEDSKQRAKRHYFVSLIINIT